MRQLYADDPELVVERNVTEVGKSGAKRQIDVKFTHHVRGHEYKTIVECKRWKDPVDRQRVDVLAATLDDLNASKGVIFTTSGFEAGAQQYAKFRGIDLFLVRDLTDDEWGRPGRIVWFHLHYYAAQLAHLQMPAAQLVSFGPQAPDLDMNLTITPGAAIDEKVTLYSESGDSGPNLMMIVLTARKRALELLSQPIGLIENGADNARAAFVMPVIVDLSALEHRTLRIDRGLLKLSQLIFDLTVSLRQNRFQIDRGAHLDLAVAVENFVTHERQVAVRRPGSLTVPLFPLSGDGRPDVDPDVLQNGSLMRVYLEPTVHVDDVSDAAAQPGVTFLLPAWEAVRHDSE